MSCCLQIARWHEDSTWLHLVRKQLGYRIEDFEQNLIGYALLTARAGVVPQMHLNTTTGLHYVPGKDPLHLKIRALSDQTAITASILEPRRAAEWEGFASWAPQPDDLGIPAQVLPADLLRTRWRHTVRARSAAHTAGRSAAHFGLHSGMWAHLAGSNASAGSGNTTFTKLGRVRMNQLVVPSGTYSVASVADLQQLARQAASGSVAIPQSRAAVHDRGLDFLPIFPPVRRLCVPGRQCLSAAATQSQSATRALQCVSCIQHGAPSNLAAASLTPLVGCST